MDSQILSFLTKFKFPLILSLLILLLSACGGAEDDPEDPSNTNPDPESATFSISGTLTAAARIDVDADLNDPLVTNADNSTFENAQQITSSTTIHGFLTKGPTNNEGNTNTENASDQFSTIADVEDVYRATLQAGQQIQMQVVDDSIFNKDSRRFSGDLDLALINQNQDLVAVSNSETEFEAITVDEAGEYFIVPYAYSGASKYILRIVNAGNTLSSTQVSGDFVPGEALVKMKSSAELPVQSKATLGLQSVPNKHAKPWATKMTFNAPIISKGAFKAGGSELQKSYTKIDTLNRIKALSQMSQVEHVSPNFYRAALRVPNDEYYNIQWHYPAMNLPQAWDITVGEGADRDIIVAVVDSGVVPHPDLVGNLLPGYDFVSNVERSRDGDGIDNNPDDPGSKAQPGASSWHGTHVAGTVAAKTNNGTGTAGVSWEAKIIPIRVLGLDSGGTDFDILQGIRYAAGLENLSGALPAQRADIINLSLGGDDRSAEFESVIREVINQGVIVVAAAGNNNSSTLFYPASYEGVISVSALNSRNEKASYSNFGAEIDISAPGGQGNLDVNGDGLGDSVLSSYVDDSSGERKPAFSFSQGTSMAAPHVAGMIALMKAVYPDLTPQQVETLLVNGDLTQDDGEPGRDDIYGYGRADALKAVQAAQRLAAGEAPPDLAPSVVASPVAVNLGSSDRAILTLENRGGGTPVLEDISGTGGSWLTLDARQSEANGLGEYIITVDRAELVSGLYNGQVVFTFSGNISVRVDVSMSVGTISAEGTVAQLYTLLYDPDANNGEGEVVAQARTSTFSNGQATYQFEGIKNGEYIVLSGTDIDHDGAICQIGEVCGLYPVFTEPERITVNGDSLDGLDFLVDIFASIPSAASAAADNNAEVPYRFSLERLH